MGQGGIEQSYRRKWESMAEEGRGGEDEWGREGHPAGKGGAKKNMEGKRGQAGNGRVGSMEKGKRTGDRKKEGKWGTQVRKERDSGDIKGRGG